MASTLKGLAKGPALVYVRQSKYLGAAVSPPLLPPVSPALSHHLHHSLLTLCVLTLTPPSLPHSLPLFPALLFTLTHSLPPSRPPTLFFHSLLPLLAPLPLSLSLSVCVLRFCIYIIVSLSPYLGTHIPVCCDYSIDTQDLNLRCGHWA